MRLDVARSLRIRNRRRAVRPPTLSVVCGTHHPGPVVAEALRPLRGVADEIVLGADETVTDDDLAWYASAADRLLTYPFTGPNQFRGWLAEHASSDWLLFLDGDEIPSAGMIEGLRSLLEDRDVAAYLLRTWWMAPDGERVLDCAPWSPEYRCRLVRNDDRLWFPSVKHSGPDTRGPKRRWENGLLHLDLVLQDVSARRRKVARYESQVFGHLTAGQSTNAGYYLPEERSDLQFRSLSDADRRRVAEVVSAPQSVARARNARRPLIDARASVADIRRTIPWVGFDDADARASIEVCDPPSLVRSGTQVHIDVRVTNLGQRKWPCGWDSQPAVRLAYHWKREGQMVVFDGLRTALPHPVRPGDGVEMSAIVEVPDNPEWVGGSSHLVFDVVAEDDRWFGVDATVVVEIGEGPRAALLAGSAPDGFVSIDDALRMRTQLSLPGVLERVMVDVDPWVELPCDFDGILDGLPTGGWSLDRAVLAELARRYERERPEVVVEFGSGTSTVLLAWLARRDGRTGTAVVSFEQDQDSAALTMNSLRERGLADLVRVVLAPLSDIAIDGMHLRCYDADIVEGTLRGLSSVIVMIDGPSRTDGGNRYPVLPMVQRSIAAPATFLLDDAWRDVELTIAERWAARSGVALHGILPVGKGVLVGVVSPSTSGSSINTS